MSLGVNVEDLDAAGVSVAGHGENLAALLGGAADCIVAALPGWQGQSATALTAAVASWCRASHVLLSRLSEHADALHVSAAEWGAMDQRDANALGR